MSLLTTPIYSNLREKKTKRNERKENSNKRSKTKEKQRARSIGEDKY
jgi:hypothetical protein